MSSFLPTAYCLLPTSHCLLIYLRTPIRYPNLMLPTLPSISDAQTLMRRGKLRPIDLVEHCLGRIHQFEDQIHAWVMVDEEGARAEAHRLGKMLDDGQEPVGPLHGIPIGIKDIIDVAGWPTLCGSKLRAGHVAEKDAAVVASLRKAGAIILGKTVTTEWASFDPPPTRNPWNLSHTPGGSSSGSATAVAMEMCLAALGTQTGGSIIRPASYCGIVGVKPYHGEIEMRGIFPFSHHLDHVGPMARSIADAESIGRVIDRVWAHSSPPPASMQVRIMFLEGGFLDAQDDETRQHFSQVRRLLARQVNVGSFPVPEYFANIHQLHRRIMAVEAAEVHREEFEIAPDAFSFHIRKLIDEGRKCDLLDYAAALRSQAVQKANFIWDNPVDGTTLLAMPATMSTAPDRTTTGDPIFNSPWSFLGLPAVTIPTGLSRSGLPFGLQFVGTLLVPCLLQFASKCEKIINFRFRPSLLK
jgi:Asp-tRNA(Asn)/Glu-tRNA(Gln) amidotransferase A subunit family amidase